jgi:CubicO group peptidase (beta-lactamase class C family)
MSHLNNSYLKHIKKKPKKKSKKNKSNKNKSLSKRSKNKSLSKRSKNKILNSKISKYLIDNNNKSGAPFSICNYGNAFTGVETFIGEGQGRVNTKVNSDMYFRYASMTKSIGMTCLAAALEDGYIESLDDPISKYISQFNTKGSYIDPESVVFKGKFDSFGTPKYSATTIPYDFNNITIRHLTTASAGFGYSFLGIGTLRSIMNEISDPSKDPLLKDSCNRNTFIAWLQLVEKKHPKVDADTIASFYNNSDDDNFNETFTQSILNRLKFPLLFKPGTQTLYDTCTTIMGAVVGAALQKKGIKKTSTQYLQSRILSPLGISSMWFNCGSSQSPNDAKTNLTDAYFVRNNTFKKSANSKNVDVVSKEQVINTTGKGKNVVTNKLYRCFDPTTNGDGFTSQSTKPYFQDYVGIEGGDTLAGGYDWSGCGTIPDFCKLLKFFILKGKNSQGHQILKSQTIEWLLTPKTKEGDRMWCFGNGAADFMHKSAAWSGGFANFLPNHPELPFDCGPNTYYWQCYYGMHYYFDTETGNYMVAGTQVPVTSWYKQIPNIDTYPYGINHTTSYEPDSLYLWKLTA